MNVEIILTPTDKHLSEIRRWLIDEEKKTGEGFYCNWGPIHDAFDRKELTIITKDDFAIGFLAYSVTDFVVHIEITEIHPRYRKKGYGKILVNETLCILKEKGNVVVELYCKPKESERIWKKLGFIRFQISRNDFRNNMYKLLIETLTIEVCNENDELIELWGEYFPNSENKVTNWTWKVKGHKLDKPIIIPAFYDWEMCWRKGPKKYYDGKVKNFHGLDIIFGNFMVIKELPRLNVARHP